MSLRRELQHENVALRGGVLILSIALRKDFARKPAYWVEIYRTTHPTAKFHRYFVVRQWGFIKRETSETVQGENVMRPLTGLQSALSAAKESLDAKIEAQWMICEDQFDSSPPVIAPTKRESSAIAAYTADWAVDFDKTLARMNVPESELPRSVKFKKAQQRRKAKAEW
jgi:hypothetical protein